MPKGPKKKRKRRSGTIIKAVVLPKDEAKKAEVLFDMLCEQDPARMKLHEALQAVSVRSGVPYGTLKRYPGKYGWNIKWKAHHEKKNTTLTAVEVNTAIRELKNVGEFDKDVSFHTIAGELKGLSYLVVATNRELVESASTMMRVYNQKVRRVIQRNQDAGVSLASMSKTDMGLIEAYMGKAREYFLLVKDYMQPTALFGMLDQLGMREAIGVMPDGMDMTALTPAKLLQLLEKLALAGKDGGKLRSTIQNEDLIKDVEAEIIADMPDLPTVDGNLVRDEENALNLDKPESKVKKKKPSS